MHDAVITVFGHDREHRFSEVRPGLYESAFDVAPGATYRLDVRLRNGNLITGEARVPAAPDLSPTPRPIRLAGGEGTVELTWRPAAGAAGYSFSYHDPSAAPGASVIGGYTTDTTAVSMVHSQCTDECCQPARLLVLSVDGALLKYHGIAVDTMLHPVTSRLRGAVGVFSAAAGDSITIEFYAEHSCSAGPP